MSIVTNRKLWAVITLIAIFTAFLAITWPYVLENYNTGKTDQRDYLQFGLEVKNHLRLNDGYRPFLFPMAISPFASEEWSYFTSAKLLNIGFSLILLGLVFGLTLSLFNLETALLALALTAFNSDLWDVFSKVVTEPLLTIFFTLALYFWYVGAQKNRLYLFILAGAAAGLAYLTKGTGQLFLIFFGVWLALAWRWLKSPLVALAGFVVAYFLAASPQLIYNILTFGTPFYNLTSSRVMWLNNWEEFYLLPADQGSLGAYLSTHTLADIINRFVSGAILMTEKRWDVLLPTISVMLILVIVAIWIYKLLVRKEGFALLPALKRDNGLKAALLIPPVIFSIWFVFFAWFAAISIGNRQYLPILPLVNVVISAMFVYSLSTFKFSANASRPYLLVTLCLVILGYSVYQIAGVIIDPPDQPWNVYQADIEQNKELDELFRGLGSAEQPKTVISGPSQLIPLWRAKSYNLTFAEFPQACQAPEDLPKFLASAQADYLIIDAQTISRRLCLQSFFNVEEADDIYSEFELTTPLPGFTVMAEYRLDRTPIMIFTPTP